MSEKLIARRTKPEIEDDPTYVYMDNTAFCYCDWPGPEIAPGESVEVEIVEAGELQIAYDNQHDLIDGLREMYIENAALAARVEELERALDDCADELESDAVMLKRAGWEQDAIEANQCVREARSALTKGAQSHD